MAGQMDNNTGYSNEERNVVPMLVKGLEILDAFREHPKGLTYSEVVKIYPQYSRVSIFRILCSFAQHSYLERTRGSNRFVLGAKFMELGRIAEERIDLLPLSTPYMEELRSKFNENVNLGKVENFELIYLKSLESAHALRVIEMPNRRVAVYCSALGKAILAHLGDEQIDEYLRVTPLKMLTRTTIVRGAELRRELKRIRQQGYAVDNEENLEGVICVGVPIFDGDNHPLAALSVSGPSLRMRAERRLPMIGALQKACRNISAKYSNKRSRRPDLTLRAT